MDAKDYILPDHGRNISGENSAEVNDGARKDSKIYDATATRAVKILGAGMQSGLTSPARPWFRLALPDPELMDFQPVKEWLFIVEDRMREVFAKSNAYNAFHHSYLELATFGTAALVELENFETIIRCRPMTIGEYFLALGADLKVDTCYRKIWMSARQMVEQFGIDNVSQPVKRAFEDGRFENNFLVICAIEKNDDKLVRVQNGMPYRSIYFEKGGEGNKVLQVTGYSEFPVMAPRWEVVGQDTYGGCPGNDVLGDVKMLQKMRSKGLILLDKLVDPPMLAPNSMKGEDINSMPGGVTYNDDAGGQQSVRSLFEVQPAFAELRNDREGVRYDIRQGLYNDLFLMIAQSDKDMTATEVAERHEEKLIMLGPVLERLHSEMLNPVIDRTFAIMERVGYLPPPPEELQGMQLKVEYISLLAQAQKAVGLGAIQQFAGFVGGIIALNPASAYKVDFDEMIDQYGDAVGVPPTMIVPDEVVAALKEQEAQKQQAKQMGEAMAQAASSAKDLGATPMGGNTALDALMGRMGGGAPQP